MDNFIVYLYEVFAGFGPVRAKRMFGGYGIYRNDLMFALVADNLLYLKADNESANIFEEQASKRFEYLKQGRPVQLLYYEAPQEIFDDPDAANLWAERAYQAAVRALAKRNN